MVVTLASPGLPISYPSYPLPAGSQFARGKTQMGIIRVRPIWVTTALVFGQQPRPLHNHNRYNRTETCIRWVMAITYNRYNFLTVSLLERLRNGHFTSKTAARHFRSETVTWIQKPDFFKYPLEFLRQLCILYNSFSRRRRWAWL